MNATQITLISSAIVLLGGTSLLAESRRGPVCTLIQPLVEGSCGIWDEAARVSHCNSIASSYGCTSQVTSTSCQGTDAIGWVQLSCNFSSE